MLFDDVRFEEREHKRRSSYVLVKKYVMGRQSAEALIFYSQGLYEGVRDFRFAPIVSFPSREKKRLEERMLPLLTDGDSNLP